MHKLHIVLLFAVLFVITVFVTACSSSKAANGPTEVNVKLKEFSVDMDRTSIPAGPVKFLITNTGVMTHEVVLERSGDDDKSFEANGKTSEAEAIAPGQSSTLEWTIDKPGLYQLACHVRQETMYHYALGMSETFTVTTN